MFFLLTERFLNTNSNRLTGKFQEILFRIRNSTVSIKIVFSTHEFTDWLLK